MVFLSPVFYRANTDVVMQVDPGCPVEDMVTDVAIAFTSTRSSADNYGPGPGSTRSASAFRSSQSVVPCYWICLINDHRANDERDRATAVKRPIILRGSVATLPIWSVPFKQTIHRLERRQIKCGAACRPPARQ